MSATASERTKGPPVESDLSQVMKHGPALCDSYGKFWATIIMLYALTKTRRGFAGIATLVSIVGGYQNFLK